MAASLPWKLKKSTTLVEDGYGNSLLVPTYGSLTLNEFDMLKTLEQEKLDVVQGNVDFIQYETKIVAAFLRSRFGLDDDVDPLDCGTGESIPLTMIHALNELIYDEAGRQKKTVEPAVVMPSAGRPPSGNSSNTIQDANSSVPTTSETAPSTSSKTPSNATNGKASSDSKLKVAA